MEDQLLEFTINRGLQSPKGHSIEFWQGRGPLKGAITEFTAAGVLAYIFFQESAVHIIHFFFFFFAFALFAIVLPSHAVPSFCYDFCGLQYKDLITVMARDKQINRRADKLQAAMAVW